MTQNLTYLAFAFSMVLLPFLASAQKITLTGHLKQAQHGNIVFERLKSNKNWKAWKDSDYSTDVDSVGNFSLSLPIANSCWWKISVGKKKSKVYLNAMQNAHIELDQNLEVIKILRQDLMDSPFINSF